jgi:hypothetical protein
MKIHGCNIERRHIAIHSVLLLMLIDVSIHASDAIASYVNRFDTTANGVTNNKRLIIGVGEWIDCTSNVGSITWEVSRYPSGAEYSTSTGPLFSWRAPLITHGSNSDLNYPSSVEYKISASRDGTSTGSGYAIESWVFKVYPPRINVYTRGASWTYPETTTSAGYIGVGFDATFQIQPTDVSFRGCRFREDACPAVNVTGYFWDKAHNHPETQSWIDIPANSTLPDQIGIPPPGYYYNPRLRVVIPAGTWDWYIGMRYGLVGGTETEWETYCHQKQSTSKPTGISCTEEKGDAKLTRPVASGPKSN